MKTDVIVMKKREAKHQILIPKILESLNLFCNYELKQTTTNRLAFSKTEKHQLESLVSAQNAGYHWKHSDQDQRVKPFDGSRVPPIPGYMIIKYPKGFVFIKILEFLKEMENSKSLTFERALEIKDYYITS